MSKRNLVIATIALAVLALGTQYFGDSSGKKSDPRIGASLAETELLKTADEIVIEDVEQQVHLQKKGDRWNVKEQSGFPADMSQLVQLLEDVTSHKIVSLISRDPKRLGHYQVLAKSDPGENSETTGAQLSIRSQGNVLFRLVVGKSRQSKPASGQPSTAGSQGTYIRINGENTVYAIWENFSLQSDPDEWVDKTLARIGKDAVESIHFKVPQSKYTFTRASKDKNLLLADLETGEVQIDNTASGLLNDLEDFTFDSLVDNSDSVKKTLKHAARVNIVLFDKTQLTFNVWKKSIGQDNEDFFIKLSPTTTFSKERLGRIADKWLFKVQEWQIKKWLKTKSGHLK